MFDSTASVSPPCAGVRRRLPTDGNPTGPDRTGLTVGLSLPAVIQSDMNILSGLTKEQFLLVRSLCIDMIFATDMAMHSALLTEFNAGAHSLALPYD
eukprot:5762800-Pyramimonas_sp.AAC.1